MNRTLTECQLLNDDDISSDEEDILHIILLDKYTRIPLPNNYYSFNKINEELDSATCYTLCFWIFRISFTGVEIYREKDRE